MVSYQAFLFPVWVGGKAGYRYSVVYEGETLVKNSRDPECDAARAFLLRGLIGKFVMVDGNTGKPRTIVDIEKAAKLCTVERQKGIPKLEKATVDYHISRHSHETGVQVDG